MNNPNKEIVEQLKKANDRLYTISVCAIIIAIDTFLIGRAAVLEHGWDLIFK